MEMGKPLAFFKGVFEKSCGLRHGKNFSRKFKMINRALRATGAKKFSERLARRWNGRENILLQALGGALRPAERSGRRPRTGCLQDNPKLSSPAERSEGKGT
jgi:hypothetical protein